MEIIEGLLSQDYLFAQTFAINAHNKQTRKDKRTPYAAHLLDVASILMKNGASETELVVGWLHDVIEDTSLTLQNVQIIFGDEVGRLVELVSEGDFTPGVEKPNKRDRKLAYIRQLDTAPLELRRSALLVSCADKLSNAHDYIYEYERGADLDTTNDVINLAFYKGLMPLYREALADTRVLFDMEQAYERLYCMWV